MATQYGILFLYSILLLFTSSIWLTQISLSIHALLLLATIYISTTVILLLIGSYFLAAMFLVTYLGAVIILFLYVIMLSNSQEVPLPRKKVENWFIIISCIFIFSDSLVFCVKSNKSNEYIITPENLGISLKKCFENFSQKTIWISPHIDKSVTILRYKREIFLNNLNSPAANVEIFLPSYIKNPYKIHYDDFDLRTRFGQKIMHETLLASYKNYPLLSIQERHQLDLFWGNKIKQPNAISNYLLQECAISTIEDLSLFRLLVKEFIFLFDQVIYYQSVFYLELFSIIINIPQNTCEAILTYKNYKENYIRKFFIDYPDAVVFNWFNDKILTLNIEQIGSFLYTHVGFEFVIAGLILLVGMFGTISLTLGQRRAIKRQEISAQVTRNHDVKMKS